MAQLATGYTCTQRHTRCDPRSQCLGCIHRSCQCWYSVLTVLLCAVQEFFANAPGVLFRGLSYAEDMEKAWGCFRHLRTVFQELEECRAFELLKVLMGCSCARPDPLCMLVKHLVTMRPARWHSWST